MLFKDQIGQYVMLEGFPQRIISLVPSQTELLFDLGLGDRIVACTKFCIHPAQMPEWVKRIGGTKNPNLNKIAALKPDLVIANKEENTKDDINQIKKTCPVWVSDINTIEAAINMIRAVGAITGTEAKSEEIAGTVESQFRELKKVCAALPTLRVAYFIWKNPFMIVGSENFIDSVLTLINLYNPWSDVPQRYPEISLSRLKKMPLDYVLLSTEPFPFKETDCLEIAAKLSPTKAILVDGEMFSWYGSRMLKMKDYLLNFRKSLAKNAS
jgi:ABC-type Fe3+-hydroxamate transport system substrate-binding protein